MQTLKSLQGVLYLDTLWPCLSFYLKVSKAGLGPVHLGVVCPQDGHVKDTFQKLLELSVFVFLESVC